jgi:glycogen synthase
VNGHVLLTTDLVGGVWDFCQTLTSAVDVRVTLLALGDQPPVHPRAATVWAPLKLEWMQDSSNDVKRTRHLVEQLVRERQIDVVHANQFAAACADVDVPVVLTLHSDVLSWRRWTLGSDVVPPEWQGYRDLVSEALQRADRVVAVSSFLAHEVRELYGFNGDIDVIHNGWPSMPTLSTHRDITLLAGRIWDGAKNIPLAALAARGWNPGDVVVAGAQHHPETGALMPLQQPLQPLGHVSREVLHQWLGRTAIYLSPARYDPFGLLPLQAALSGAALLLSDIPSYRELWDGAARFFRSDDAGDLRREWQDLLADPLKRNRYATQAFERATRSYAVERMAERYQRVYATADRSVPA